MLHDQRTGVSIRGHLGLLCLAGLLLCLAPRPGLAERIRLATLDWEPYVGQTLPGQGYAAEVVREAFRRAGFEAELVFYPWARALKETMTGDFQGCFPEYFSAQRDREFLLSRPFPGGPLGLFARKSSHIAWKTLPDLAPYTIGVVRTYVNTEEFDRADYLRKEETSDDLTSLRMLAAGRLDLAVADKLVGLHLVRQHLGPQAGDLVFLEPPLEEKALHVGFSRAGPNAPELKEAFDAALASMEEDGTIARLRAAHGLP